ncbi:MAG: hypothetical protein ACAI44_32240 [Candidatus Sericytochromatia bacterium]
MVFFKNVGALFLTALCLAGPGLLPARAHTPAGSRSFNECEALRVNGPYAWLKELPGLKARTLRSLPKGEMLALVKRSDGNGYTTSKGWWLVQTATSQRGFVHSSVMGCARLPEVVIQPTPAYFNLPLHRCRAVRVTAPYAWLKAAPSAKAATYRTAPKGELLSLVKDAKGHGYMQGGWWLVQTAVQRRFWAHQSVFSCAG